MSLSCAEPLLPQQPAILTNWSCGTPRCAHGSSRYFKNSARQRRCPPHSCTGRILPAPWLSDLVAQSLNNRPGYLIRAACPSQIGRERAAFSNDPLHCFHYQLGGFALAQVVEHHSPGPDGGERVGYAAARDI